MKKQLFLWIVLLLAATASVEAGDSLKVFRRTGIYAEIGGPGYIHLNGNLEHYFVNKKWAHIGARAGYGSWATWSGNGWEGLLTVSGLLGKKYHFLELQAGSVVKAETSGKRFLANDNQPFYRYDPFVSIGYTLRVGHLLLKASLNSDSPINVGLGLIF
jgi:hypothetical protein